VSSLLYDPELSQSFLRPERRKEAGAARDTTADQRGDSLEENDRTWGGKTYLCGRCEKGKTKKKGNLTDAQAGDVENGATSCTKMRQKKKGETSGKEPTS